MICSLFLIAPFEKGSRCRKQKEDFSFEVLSEPWHLFFIFFRIKSVHINSSGRFQHVSDTAFNLYSLSRSLPGPFFSFGRRTLLDFQFMTPSIQTKTRFMAIFPFLFFQCSLKFLNFEIYTATYKCDLSELSSHNKAMVIYKRLVQKTKT